MKKSMLICAPLATRSGYGDHARDLFHSFYDLDKFDIKIIDVPWGACPRNALDVENEKDKLIIDRIVSPDTIKGAPDVYVDVRIPNEFQQIGKFNIVITAGIETNAVSQQWLEGCNKMDLIIVPSEHSKKGFVDSVYDKVGQDATGQTKKFGEFKMIKPIEVLFEGVDLDTYKPIDEEELDEELNLIMNETIQEDFAFLLVGQWVKGGYGEDRKDIPKTIKLFLETFLNKPDKPALVLKTSGATLSILDREDILSKIKMIKNQFPEMVRDQLPNVYLIHGDLSTEQMNSLYNHPKIKSLVSLTPGEGFGRPMLEATLTGLPVMASNWSGQCDFLDEKYSILLGGELQQVPQSAVWENIIIPQSKWFVVNEEEVRKAFSFVRFDINSVNENSKKLMEINRNDFSHKNMTKKLGEILDNHLKTQVNLTLPKLTKVTEEEVKEKKVDFSEFESFFEKEGVKPNEYMDGVE